MTTRRVLGWLHGFTGTKASPRPEELAILRAILVGPDPRYQKLIAQFEQAPQLDRLTPTPTTFRVGPTSTFEDLSFPLETKRVVSEWVSVRDTLSGRTLEFRVVVGRHGFLRGLEGRTEDEQPWPSTWSADPAALKSLPAGLLDLPALAEQGKGQDMGRRDLTEWLGTALPSSALFVQPATEPMIAAHERRLGGTFPRMFRAFLGITDGLDLDGLRIHGVDDVYEIDNVHMAAWLVAWDADDVDDFIVVVAHDGIDQSVYRINLHRPDETWPARIADDFRGYLRERVRHMAEESKQ